jgi:hypothetical protein
MVLECSFLTLNGDVHSTFENYLFQIEPITAYLCRSKSNVVICELEVDLSDGMQSMGYPTATSQSGYPIVLSQPSYPVLQIPPADFGNGYGFPSMSQSERLAYGMSEYDL